MSAPTPHPYLPPDLVERLRRRVARLEILRRIGHPVADYDLLVLILREVEGS